MKLLIIATRSLVKNRRRTITTCTSIIAGVCAMVLFWGYTASIKHGLETNIVRESGHLQIQHVDFALLGSANPSKYSVEDYQKVLNVIHGDEVLKQYIVATSPRVRFSGIAGNYEKSLSKSIVAFGIDPNDQEKMREWDLHGAMIPSKTALLKDQVADAVIVGETLSKILQLCDEFSVPDCPSSNIQPAIQSDDVPKDIITLSANFQADTEAKQNKIDVLAVNNFGVPNVASLTLVGVEKQGVKSFDSIFLSMQLKQAQSLLYGSESNAVTSIAIQLYATEELAFVKEHMNKLLTSSFPDQNITVRTFKELNQNFSQTNKMFSAIFGFISVLIAIVVIFTVYNSISSSVSERTVEIGSLRALGLKRANIKNLFLIEGILQGIIGCVLGCLVAWFIAQIINNSGLTWLPPGYAQRIPLNVSVNDMNFILGVFIASLLVTSGSSYFPAGKAAKLKIVEALRHV